MPRLHRTDRFFELQKARTQGIKAVCRFVCKLKPLGGPAKKNNAQHILKRADLLPDSSWRYRKFVRCLGEA